MVLAIHWHESAMDLHVFPILPPPSPSHPSFVFKVKSSPRTLLNNVFTVLFNYLLQSVRQIHNFIFPKLFFFFEQRTVPDTFYTLPENWNFFHEENFIIKVNGKCKGTVSGAYNVWIQISQASCKHFCLVIKETHGLALSWWQYLELIIWFSRMAHNRGLPSHPTIHTSSS